ncbi:hypothetical protein KM043_016252 [Ampulex compressa]|nr:hypothetical protein KM043_016252 [Ampulex compressa]
MIATVVDKPVHQPKTNLDKTEIADIFSPASSSALEARSGLSHPEQEVFLELEACRKTCKVYYCSSRFALKGILKMISCECSSNPGSTVSLSSAYSSDFYEEKDEQRECIRAEVRARVRGQCGRESSSSSRLSRAFLLSVGYATTQGNPLAASVCSPATNFSMAYSAMRENQVYGR